MDGENKVAGVALQILDQVLVNWSVQIGVVDKDNQTLEGLGLPWTADSQNFWGKKGKYT